MAIQVLKRPYERNWSGNPIHYTLFSADAEAEATNYFEIRIKFQRMDYADYIDLITLPYRPVQGTAKIDIQDLLDGVLEYELPIMPESDEYLSVLLAKKMTGFFYLEYREITTAEPDPDWTSDDANEFFVIKGGISFHKWRGDNYWINYYDIVKPFLGWESNQCLHSLTERMYLAWLNYTDENPNEIKMCRTVYFTDGSSDVAYLDCTVPTWLVCYFPTGAAQLNLESIDPAKQIYYWEMQLVKVSANPIEPLSEAFIYYADNKKDYNQITLNYRNSLGGIGSARVRGVIDYTQERNFTEVERVVLHNYFEEHFIPGRIAGENSSEILVYKGDLGHLTKEEQDRLRDVHFKREVWWEQQLKWLPVKVQTPSSRLRMSNDSLFSSPIEFCIAAGDEYYYTPEGVNLADEAEEPGGLICTAIINTLTSNYVPGTGWIINWTLVSGSPNKYFISTPGVSGGAPGESISTSYTFPWLPVGDNVITVQPVCLIGGVYYLGAAQSITVTVAAACVNVGITGAPITLPDAIEDIPYSYTMSLTGTAPFTLSGITKPAWMSIAVVGSTVEITGTPVGADVGTDVAIEFTVENCAAVGSVAFADTIDVLADAGNGDFVADNSSTGLNYINNVSVGGSPFYTISTGSFPVVASATAEGKLTSAVTDPVTVSITRAGAYVLLLGLYKNGVLVEEIDIPSSGSYSFAAAAFLITDNMEIKISLF